MTVPFLLGTRRDYDSGLRKHCGKPDDLTTGGGASDDAIPSDADASGANPNGAGRANAIACARASDGPSALVPAADDRRRLAW
jgi:hypothetical protein